MEEGDHLYQNKLSIKNIASNKYYILKLLDKIKLSDYTEVSKETIWFPHPNVG